MRAEMLKNDHGFESHIEIERIRVKNGYIGATSYLNELEDTFGFDY